jgi:hypothetical protein
VVSASPRSLYPPGKSCGSNCRGTRGGVGPRAGLDGCSEEKVSCPHRGLNPEPYSLHRITILTTLARPLISTLKGLKYGTVILNTVAHSALLGSGFSWFPCVYKRMLRWFPRFQVATTCFSCSPPDLSVNLLVISFVYLYTC